MALFPCSSRSSLLVAVLVAVMPLALTLPGCFLLESRVDLAEMRVPPRVTIIEDSLIVHISVPEPLTSAYAIHRVDAEIEERRVVLTGYKAIGEEHRDRFALPLFDLDATRADIDKAEWVWENGDGTRVELVEVDGGIASEGEGVE